MSLLKRFYLNVKMSDEKSIRFRWGILFFFVIFIWTLTVVLVSPNLFIILSEPTGASMSGIQYLINITSLFFAPQALFVVFSAFFGLLFAYQFATKYFRALFGKSSFIHSGFSLGKRIFGISKNETLVINCGSLSEKKTLYLAGTGGMARIMIPAEFAAILEKSDHSIQIVGPTINFPGNHYTLGNFEELKHVVKLQNQSVKTDVEIFTKDGIPLMIRNLRAVFSVDRDSKTSTLTRPFPFSAQGIYSIYYLSPQASMTDKFIDILKCETVQFARNFNNSDLISGQQQEIYKNVEMESEIAPLDIFRKRKIFEYLKKDTNSSFFTSHIHFKNKKLRPFKNVPHSLYTDTVGNQKQIIGKADSFNGKNTIDFFSLLQSQLNSALIKNGFQLVLLTRGIIERKEKNNADLS